MIHEKQLELFPFHKLYKQQRSCQLGMEESHHITFFLFSSSSFPLILPHPFTPSNISLFSNKEQFPCLYVFGTYHPLTMLNRAFPQTQHLFCPPHAHTSSIQTIWRDRMFKFGGVGGGEEGNTLWKAQKRSFLKSIICSWKAIQIALLVFAYISWPSVASSPSQTV